MGSRAYRDQYYPSAELEVCQESLDQFFKFMYDRHMVWVRRFKEKLSEEKWTDDLILKTYKYTNVYRELDRGTLWYLDTVGDRYIGFHDNKYGRKQIRNLDFVEFQRLLWNTIVYRLCNRIETFAETGFPEMETFDSKNIHNDFWVKLNTIASRNLAVMTSAHLTCPTRLGWTKVEGYMGAICDLHQKLPDIARQIICAKTSKEIFGILRSVNCVGNFIAYEVLCDLIYLEAIGNKETETSFTLDDWANVGPGAIEGIRLIYPSTTGRVPIYNRMVQLCNEQEEHFKRLGINFPFYERFTKGHLSLRTLEHSLCELQKIWLQRRGLGKQRMIFTPNANRTFVRNGKTMRIIVDDSGEHTKEIEVNNT
jgi:hypothetical protein